MRQAISQYFELEKLGTSIKTEFFAALSTFATMAFIMIVNPRILSKAGMDFGAVMTATIITAAFATTLMGLLGRFPFALAPGMGLNGYFTFTIVLAQGLSWQSGLAAALIASFILIILNYLGIRQLIMEKLPASLRTGTIAGIGIYIAFIGLKDVGIIVGHEETIMTVGDISSPEVILALLGVILITTLMNLQFKPAIILTIFLLWAFGIAGGLTTHYGFVSLPPSLAPTFFHLDFSNLLSKEMISAIFSFVFVMIFDATGSLLSLTDYHGSLSEKGEIPRLRKALFCDAAGTALGSLLGTSPLSNYLESSAGISTGGKSGLTAVFVGLLFLSCLFFSPLASSIPVFAISPVFIVIGALMTRGLRHAEWDNLTEYIPAFLTMITIPLTLSIPAGIGLGLITYVTIRFISGNIKDIHWIIWVIAALFLLKLALV